MNNKKVQAHMQLNVTFVSDAAKMVKDLQTSLKSLDFSSGFTKQLENNLNKSFKDTLTNLDKMADGLSKKGLNPKQYMDFFTAINTKIEDSTHILGKLKEGFQSIYDSKENQDAIKNLEQLKKKLEEVNRVVTNQKKLQTRQQTAKDKVKTLTGYDYDDVKGELKKIQSRKATGKDLTAGQEKWLYGDLKLSKDQAVELFKILKQIDGLVDKEKAGNKASQDKFGANPFTAQANLVKDINKLESQILTEEVLKSNVSTVTQLEDKLLGAAGASRTLTTGMNSEMPKATAEAERLAKASSTINEILSQFGISFTAATVVRGFQDLIKEAFNFYKSLDSALNEIYVVSNLSSDAVNNLKTDFITMAKDTGMALDDITRSATLFYQQGLTTDEVMEMTRVTSEFAKVAGIDAADAADKLTAAVNGYCLAAEDAASVADKFNKVAAASAADIDELSTAFSKAAAQANQAGVGMDNYLAYIATMVEATREAPENIGTSLKTIMSRMQQVKMSGTTEDGETDVNQVETALESVGIALRDANGELRDLEDVFAELGPKWQSLDRNTQAYLGTIIAGTRQQSRFITLMQNWDRVLDLADQSANSAGQQALMHAKAMDSIESKVKQFQVAWQEFISNLTDSDVIKGIVSLLTKFVDLFNGGNKPVMAMAMAVGLLSTKLKDLQEAGTGKVKSWWNDRQATKEKNIGIRAQSRKDITAFAEDIKQGEARLASLEQQQKELEIKKQQLETEKGVTAEIEKQIAANQKDIDDTKKDIKLNKKLKGQAGGELGATYGQTVTEIGVAVNMASMALSSYDDNLAGVVGTMGSAVTAIGQFATGNYVGAAISLVTAVYQAVQTFSNWEENIAAKLSEAANKVEEAATKAANLNTGIKSSESLVKEYDKLSQKMNRTTAEQERLNAVVQQLGDTHDVEVLTDSYGNLSLSIDDVATSLQKLSDDRDKAIAELQKEETSQLLKATGGITNTNTVSDYYDEILTGSKTTYKSLLRGVEEDLSDEVRSISSSLANEFSSNFTETIYNEVANNAKSYTGETLIGAMRNYDININTRLDDKAWNELYAEIGELEGEIENMSYNEVEAKLEAFYDTWGKANKITLEEWNILKDAINNTVFENKSLLEFYRKTAEMDSKASGTYYDEKITKLDAQIAQADKDAAGSKKAALGFGAAGTAIGAIGAFGAANAWNPAGLIALGVAGLGAVAGGIAALNTEEAKMQRALNKTKRELEKERKEYLKKVDEDNSYLDGVDDAETWINAQVKVADTLKTLNAEQQNYLGNIDSLFDFEGLRADESTTYADTIEAMTKGMADLDTDTSRANYMVEYANKMLSDPNLDAAVREKWQDVLDDAMANLQLPTGYTFTQLANELDSVSANLRTINGLVDEFKEKGGMTLDSFKELAGILDGIKLEDLYAVSDLDNGVNYVNQYIDALDNLKLAYDANTGMITMNGESLKTLQQIQQVQAQAEITNMKNQLIAKKYQTKAEIAYIDAQIEGVKAALAMLETKSASELTAADLTDAANKATQKSFTDTTNALNNSYETDVQNMNTWTMAVVSNLDTATQAWGKYWSAAAGNGENLSALLNEAKKGQNVKFEKADWFTDAAGDDGKFNKSEVDALKSKLNNQITALENLKAKYSKSLEVYEAEIGLLESMEGADLSKFGADDAAKLEKYIGKLKEIYNILNRIQNLEHRLSTLDTYSEIAVGDQYGKYYEERLAYTEELSDQYKFLVTEQKKFTNGYKDFIEKSAVADVFDFDEFGQIIINFDKYNKLQDTAADGEKSLKEQADELYETYTEMYEELQGYFDEYIAYLKKAIDLHQEAIDAYVETENKVAEAIKEIYQKILDTKLDAIDKEKEAIEELRQAREDARKDKENAEAISGLQTNIQRAMMDTSGASDISLIKAQKDMNDKLEDIAEDKYGEMLDDIIARLEDEQEALQDNFDQMFENTEWLFSFIEENIMNDEAKIQQILQQTDEWQQQSNLERKQGLEKLSTDYATYMAAMRGGEGEGSTIYDVWDRLGELKSATQALDEALKTREINVGTAVANAVAEGVKVAAAAYTSGGGGLNNNNNNNNNNENNNDKPTYNDNYNPAKVTAPTWKVLFSNGAITTKEGKVGETCSLPTAETRKGYMFKGWSIDGGNPITKAFKPEKGLHNAVGVYEHFTQIDTSKGTTTTPPAPTTPFPLVTGPTLKLPGHAKGGMLRETGPIWVDGTYSNPEAVLTALQTKHFINFAESLDKMYNNHQMAMDFTGGSVNIGSIEFNVESMSSVEDGERAFTMFVDKFKEIGDRTGIRINTFKNTL